MIHVYLPVTTDSVNLQYRAWHLIPLKIHWNYNTVHDMCSAYLQFGEFTIWGKACFSFFSTIQFNYNTGRENCSVYLQYGKISIQAMTFVMGPHQWIYTYRTGHDKCSAQITNKWLYSAGHRFFLFYLHLNGFKIQAMTWFPSLITIQWIYDRGSNVAFVLSTIGWIYNRGHTFFYPVYNYISEFTIQRMTVMLSYLH
jgi:hypothetical protein